jgi:transcriptional regulator with XRE-family HTH domain
MATSQWLEEIGLLVRARRQAEGYESQKALAAEVGVHADTIGRLERGESVSLDILESVARAIRTDPRKIAGCGIEPDAARLEVDERRLVEAYRRSSKKDRSIVEAALGLSVMKPESEVSVESTDFQQGTWDGVERRRSGGNDPHL